MTADVFTKVGKKNGNKVVLFEEKLDQCRIIIRESELLSELVTIINTSYSEIDRIRCLALGSFHEETPARYQLALLLELIDILERKYKISLKISIYDPAFTEDDINFINMMGENWSIDEKSPGWLQHSQSTLFYLPHAPLELTENIIRNENPKIWLANNLIQHTDRYTKRQLFDKYPYISKLVSLLDIPNSHPNDGFTKFLSKKKKRHNNIKSLTPQGDPDYSSIHSYFTICKFDTTFDNGALLKNKPWNNSFSDLALQIFE